MNTVENVPLLENKFITEKINKPYIVANPTRNVYVETRQKYLTNLNKPVIKQSVFDQIKDKKHLIQVAQQMAILKYGSENCYLHDLACGILTAITQRYNKISDCEITNSNITIDMSIQSIKKLMFGHLVNNNGNAINGVGHLVKNPWYNFKDFFTMKTMFPTADVSLSKTINNEKCEFVIRGNPLRVNRVYTYNKNIVGFQIQLDRMFYPVSKDKQGLLKINDHFLHQVIGLTSFLNFGKMLYLKENPDGLNVDPKTARRLILTYQSAFECNKFPFVNCKIVRQQTGNTNRIEIALNENAVKEIYPRAVGTGDGRINYKTFINFCNTVGKYYQYAIKYFNLQLSDKIYIPTDDKSARFEKGKVLIICEKGTAVQRIMTNKYSK